METPFVNMHSHSLTYNSGITVLTLDLSPDIILPKQKHIAIGLHPHNSNKFDPEQLYIMLEPYIPSIDAIGEIGLDRHIPIPIITQEKIFCAQLNFAYKHNLPVIIHCVKAYADMLRIIKNFKRLTYIFHGFYANGKILDALLKYNSYFSVGLREISRIDGKNRLLQIPLDRLLLETDDSLHKIEDVYYSASQILGVDIDYLKSTIYNNFKNIIND